MKVLEMIAVNTPIAAAPVAAFERRKNPLKTVG
jgi:hypothetical protein